MQRPCSAAFLAIGETRNAIRTCVEFRQGFKSPVLESRTASSVLRIERSPTMKAAHPHHLPPTITAFNTASGLHLSGSSLG